MAAFPLELDFGSAAPGTPCSSPCLRQTRVRRDGEWAGFKNGVPLACWELDELYGFLTPWDELSMLFGQFDENGFGEVGPERLRFPPFLSRLPPVREGDGWAGRCWGARTSGRRWGRWRAAGRRCGGCRRAPGTPAASPTRNSSTWYTPSPLSHLHNRCFNLLSFVKCWGLGGHCFGKMTFLNGKSGRGVCKGCDGSVCPMQGRGWCCGWPVQTCFLAAQP